MVGAHSLSVLAAGAAELGLGLTREQLARFERYYSLLEAGRHRAALTSVAGAEAVQRRHFLESLALLRTLETAGLLVGERSMSVLDLGTGAGLPGLPMKIARPYLRLTLLDATAKKTSFLDDLVAELALPDVRVVTGRAEELAHDREHRDAYDIVVARAVAPLAVLLELSLPFLKVGGVLAAPKGSGVKRELSQAQGALRLLGGTLVSTAPLDIPGSRRLQTLAVVRKVSPTPEKYPRRAGVPQKRPL